MCSNMPFALANDSPDWSEHFLSVPLHAIGSSIRASKGRCGAYLDILWFSIVRWLALGELWNGSYWGSTLTFWSGTCSVLLLSLILHSLTVFLHFFGVSLSVKVQSTLSDLLARPVDAISNYISDRPFDKFILVIRSEPSHALSFTGYYPCLGAYSSTHAPMRIFLASHD